jgi:heme exporter protein D
VIRWACFGGYIVAAVIAGRIILSIRYRDWRRGSQRLDFGDEGEDFDATLGGIFWPVTLLGWLIYALFVYVLEPLTKPAALRRDQRRDRERAERARAAEQAQTFNLPMPPDDTTGGPAL